MATYYIDYFKGNDSTGDGSSNTPYKTVDKVHALVGGVIPENTILNLVGSYPITKPAFSGITALKSLTINRTGRAYEKEATFPGNLMGFWATRIGNYYYIFGGSNSSNPSNNFSTPTTKIYRCDYPTCKNWVDCTATYGWNLNTATCYHKGFVYGDRVYLVAGATSSVNTPHAIVQSAPINDLGNWTNHGNLCISNTWPTKGSALSTQHYALWETPDRIYIYGGLIAGGGSNWHYNFISIPKYYLATDPANWQLVVNAGTRPSAAFGQAEWKTNDNRYFYYIEVDGYLTTLYHEENKTPTAGSGSQYYGVWDRRHILSVETNGDKKCYTLLNNKIGVFKYTNNPLYSTIYTMDYASTYGWMFHDPAVEDVIHVAGGLTTGDAFTTNVAHVYVGTTLEEPHAQDVWSYQPVAHDAHASFTWVTTNNMLPTGVFNGGQTLVGDKMYLIGGNTTSDWAATNVIQSASVSTPTTWSTASTNFPSNIAGNSIIHVDNLLYSICGHTGSSLTVQTIYVTNALNPVEWISLGSVGPASFTSHAAFVWDNYVYTVGGLNGGSVFTGVVYRAHKYNLTVWSTIGALDVPIIFCSAFYDGAGYIYVSGMMQTGFNGNYLALYRASTSNLAKWSKVTTNLTCGPRQWVQLGNYIYAFGGALQSGTSNNAYITGNIYRAPITDLSTFTQVGAMPESLLCLGSPFVLPSGAVLIAGGRASSSASSRHGYVMDVSALNHLTIPNYKYNYEPMTGTLV